MVLIKYVFHNCMDPLLLILILVWVHKGTTSSLTLTPELTEIGGYRHKISSFGLQCAIV